MARFIIPLVFLVLALGSAGCRMCGSPYDLCTPAFLERHDDYRGCDPMYRSGSIFSRGGNDCYLGSDGGLLIADRSMNAGNFGVTVPVKGAKLPSKSPLESKNGTGSAIGIPNMDGWLDGLRRRAASKNYYRTLCPMRQRCWKRTLGLRLLCHPNRPPPP